jgi:predicted ester cyclase
MAKKRASTPVRGAVGPLVAPKIDRVAAIRHMLENNVKSDIYSPNFVSRKPWDLAAKRQAKTAAVAEKTFFDPSRSFKISVEDAIEQNDKVVIRWRLRGTWTGGLGSVKATGKPINVTGVNIYRFVADKIVEETGEMDWASFAQQAFGVGGVGAGAVGGGGAAAVSASAACQEGLAAVSRPPEVFTGAGPGTEFGPG